MRFKINKIVAKYLGVHFVVDVPTDYEGGEVITIDEHDREIDKLRAEYEEKLTWQRETCDASLRVSRILRENDKQKGTDETL